MRVKLSKILLVFFALFIGCNTLKAQSFSSVLIEPDPIFLSKGVSGPDPSSFHWIASDFGFSLVSGKWSPDYIDNGVVALLVHKKFAKRFVAALRSKFVYDFWPTIYRDENGGSERRVRPALGTATFMLSYRISDYWAFGAALTYMHSVYGYTPSVNGFAGDISGSFSNGPLSICLALRNLSTKRESNPMHDLPNIIKFGVHYRVIPPLEFTFDSQYLMTGHLMAGLGLEYLVLNDELALRCGYHYGSGGYVIPSHFSCGFGYQRARIGVNTSLLFDSGTLNKTLLIGMSFVLEE